MKTSVVSVVYIHMTAATSGFSVKNGRPRVPGGKPTTWDSHQEYPPTKAGGNQAQQSRP